MPPGSEHEPGVSQRGEQHLIEAVVGQTAIEACHQAVLHWLVRCDIMPFDLRPSCDQRRMAEEIGSQATRAPDSNVSATSTRHSREKSSTRFRMWKGRLQIRQPETKSSDQRWFGPCGSTIDLRTPAPVCDHHGACPALRRWWQHEQCRQRGDACRLR